MKLLFFISVFFVLKLILCSPEVTDITIKHALDTNDILAFETKTSFRLLDKVTYPSKIQIPLSQNEKSNLFSLGEDNLWYRLKLSTNRSDSTFLTSTKACMLINAKLMATLIILLDHTNNIIGFNFHPNTNEICDTVSKTDKYIADKIIANIIIQSPDNGILPDTFSFIQKLEVERETKEKGATKDNRSFIGKYWMYIVPIFVVMFLSTLNNPEGMERNNGQPSTSSK